MKMANGKPIVRPGSDGVLVIQVGERTIEIKAEYLDEFVFEIENSQEFINKIKSSTEAQGSRTEDLGVTKHEFKSAPDGDSTKILFTRVEAAQGGK
jgi:hypothetical protein